MSIDLTQARRQLLAAAEAGVGKAGEYLLEASQNQVPVDTGDLKESGRVRHDGLKAAVSYRDPIAVIVHENMQAHHDVGNAKFLENPMNSERDEVGRIIATEVKTRLGG